MCWLVNFRKQSINKNGKSMAYKMFILDQQEKTVIAAIVNGPK